MSTLSTFREHCARMATAEHKPECPSLERPKWTPWADGDDIPQGARVWRAIGLVQLPPPKCDGCVTDADRALFRQMADEVDHYLQPQPDLFGGLTHEEAS